MASGGGIMQIVWLVVILWVLVEFVFPLGKKLVNEVTSLRAQAYVPSHSYL